MLASNSAGSSRRFSSSRNELSPNGESGAQEGVYLDRRQHQLQALFFNELLDLWRTSSLVCQSCPTHEAGSGPPRKK